MSCGAEDELHSGGQCWACVLGYVVNDLLTDPVTGSMADDLLPLAWTSTSSNNPVGNLRVDLAAAAGMAAPALFVAGFISQAWLHPDYSWTAMFVSELSLGPNGWIRC